MEWSRPSRQQNVWVRDGDGAESKSSREMQEEISAFELTSSPYVCLSSQGEEIPRQS